MVGPERLKPGVEGGEKLSEEYEIFREWEPDAALEFDQAVLLATGALAAEEIRLSTCDRCGCALLLDKRGKVKTSCARCRKNS